MKLIIRVVGVLIAAVLCQAARADAFPDGRVIRVISGYSAGGGATVALRLFCEELGAQLNTKVILDPRPGASFSIAARNVKNAAPDGYTLYAGGMGSDPLLTKNGISVLNELKPVSMVTEIPLVFVTNAAKPLKTMAQVAEYAKANPGKLNFASVGGNVYLNLMMNLLAKRLDITYLNVPYKGAPQIQAALITGEVDITLAAITTAAANLNGGRITPILIGSIKRSPVLPGVPSLEEVGLQDFSIDSKVGLWAPLDTPPAIVNAISAAAQATLKNTAYAERFQGALGSAPMGTTPEFMAERFNAEYRVMQDGVRLSGFVPE